jgi:hypothetical protein
MLARMRGTSAFQWCVVAAVFGGVAACAEAPRAFADGSAGGVTGNAGQDASRGGHVAGTDGSVGGNVNATSGDASMGSIDASTSGDAGVDIPATDCPGGTHWCPGGCVDDEDLRDCGTLCPPCEGNVPSAVGRRCVSDSDCPGGLSCLTSESDDYLGGGPANGYCTAPCTTDLDCMAFDAHGICLGTSDAVAYCVQSCTPGEVGLGEVKCQDRSDVGCDTVGGESFCRPVCRSDSDCCSVEDGEDCASRENIRCDLGVGVCVSEAAEGKAIGEDCHPEAETNGCASGMCLLLAEGYGICSALCSVGTVGCGSDSTTPSDPGEPLCLDVFGGSLGDVGRCGQRCDCDGDCLHSDGVCWGGPFGEDPDGKELWGTQGLCTNSGFADTANAEERVGIQCVGPDGGAATTEPG